jgi:hypothetical protein
VGSAANAAQAIDLGRRHRQTWHSSI